MGNPPPKSLIRPITERRRADLLLKTLGNAPEPSAIRVFGYGSLMWNPCFDYTDSSPAILHNYRRGFSIWSVYARGTPENPGLGFALEKETGSICDGIVFTLPSNTTSEDLIPLWEREMWTDTYRPVWTYVEANGECVAALTFVVSKDHIQYAGDLPTRVKAEYIVKAAGKYGTCSDYLAQTVYTMRRLGINDAQLEELLEIVEGLNRTTGK